MTISALPVNAQTRSYTFDEAVAECTSYSTLAWHVMRLRQAGRLPAEILAVGAYHPAKLMLVNAAFLVPRFDAEKTQAQAQRSFETDQQAWCLTTVQRVPAD